MNKDIQPETAAALLDTLLYVAPVGLTFLDRDYRFLWINTTLAALNGLPVAAHLGRSVREVLPDLAPAVEPILADVLANGRPVVDVEVVEQRNQGSPRVWQASYFPVWQGDQIIGVGIVASDVTALNEAESRLATLAHEREERQRLFDRIMATTPDMVYLYDVIAERNIYANRSAGLILGYTPEQIQAMGSALLPTIMHPDDYARRPETLKAIGELPDGAVNERQYRVRHADGSWRWLNDRTLIFERTPDGRPQSVLGVVEDITTRRAMEAALREYTADLETFTETMPIAVLMSHDATGTKITGNSAAARLLRMPPGSNLSRTAPPDEQLASFYVRRHGQLLSPEELPIQYACRNGVTVYDPELEIVFDDGTVTWIAGYVSPLRTAEGGVRGAIAAYLDISENRRVAMLERLFARLSAIIVGAPDYATLLQHVTELTVPDLADYTLLDMVAADRTILRVAAAHLPQDWQQWIATLRRYPPDPQRDNGVPEVLRTGEPLLIPVLDDAMLVAVAQSAEHLAALRAISPCSTMVVPLSARGNVIGALTLSRVSEQQRYNERDLATARELATRIALALETARLYQAEQQARVLAEQAHARISSLQAITAALSAIMLPQEIAQITVSKSAAVLGAYAGGLVLLAADGATLEIIGSVGYAATTLATYDHFPLAESSPISDVVRSGQAVFVENQPELAARYPPLVQEGSKRSMAIAAYPLVVEEQTIGGLAFSFEHPRRFDSNDRDFLAAVAGQCAQALHRARLYEQAQAAIRVRDTFFSIAAHELKTPLTSLFGQAQLMQRRSEREEPLSARHRRSVEVITAQAGRLNTMISELLDVARIERAQITIERNLLDLRSLLRRVVEELEPTLDKHRLEYREPATPCLVLGDAARLEQVIQNLLQNSVKYSPDGGAIQVHLTTSASQHRLQISDRGIGIPAAALPNLFQRFYRAENANSRRIGGMGVGLFLVKELVNLHGGSIAVESVEGQGSTFTIQLPAHSATSSDTAQALSERQAQD